MAIMSNSLPSTDLGIASETLRHAGPGGGRTRADLASHQIRPLTKRAQIFQIPDGGDPALQRFILEKIQFHFAVFPFLSLPDQETH